MLLEATFVELKPPGKLSIGLETVSSLVFVPAAMVTRRV
jgi:hypothetical protein